MAIPDFSDLLERAAEYIREIQTDRSMRTVPEQLYDPPCACSYCVEQLRTVSVQQDDIAFAYTGRLDNLKAAAFALRFVESRSEDLDDVRTALRSSERLICDWWREKADNNKRKSFLKELRPDMYDESRHSFNQAQIIGDNTELNWGRRDSLLLPYMTLETLSEDGTNLLRLLHCRVSVSPEAWVAFDNRYIFPAWRAGVLKEEFNEGCITMYGEAYGTWTQFDKHAVHNGNSYAAPRALLILEAQAVIARFLYDFVNKILEEDGSTAEHVSEKLAFTTVGSGSPSRSQETPKTPRELVAPSTSLQAHCQDVTTREPSHDGSESRTNYYSEPFSPAPFFNKHTISQLSQIVFEKALESRDHCLLLQIDPAYFHEITAHWHKCDLSSISPAKIAKYPELHNSVGRVIVYSMTQQLGWQYLADELNVVQREFETHCDNIRLGTDLPVTYDKALGRLAIAVIKRLNQESALLRAQSITSQGWEPIWEVLEHCVKGTIGISQRSKEIQGIFACFWALGMIRDWSKTAGTKDIAIILKSLDIYLARCGKAEGAKIDAATYRRITNMAAMYKILAAIRMHRPTVSAYSPSIDESRSSEYYRWWSHCRMSDANENLYEPQQFNFGDALSDLGIFRVPTGKKTAEWLVQADRAHQALSRVWSIARERYQRMYQDLNLGIRNTKIIVKLMSQGQSRHALDMLALERKDICMKIAKDQVDSEIENPPYQSSSRASTSIEVPERPSNASGKAQSETKTRSPDSSLSLSQYALPTPKNARSVDTLRLIFPSATCDLKGTVHWTDFVTTMRDLGCPGKHRGGSEWIFRLSSQAENGSAGRKSEPTVQSAKGTPYAKGVPYDLRVIVIQQPHPEHDLGAVQLQQIGKRLWRQFEWKRDRFEDI